MTKIDHNEGLYLRQILFNKARRVVVKVGSAILTGKEGLDSEVIKNLARGVSYLHDSGREVLLVSSGAVAAGRRKLHINIEGELTTKQKQAFAAIGQSLLMHDYDEAFTAYGKNIAQILLTHSDLADRKRYLNVRNTLFTLLGLGVIPILNENDTVATEELKFSDNDNLGALVANLIEADMFISLTDVDALYNGNPNTDTDAEPIYTVPDVTNEILEMAGNSKSSLGTGGMRSKIQAAKTVAAGGGSSLIAPGRRKDVLQHLFSGESVGTFFLPRAEKMQSRKRWIAYVLKPKGKLILDDGACRAICLDGKSLLPSGITRAEGSFETGDAVVCCNQAEDIIASGLVNCSYDIVNKIKGCRTSEVKDLAGNIDVEEVIHRDNLVLV